MKTNRIYKHINELSGTVTLKVTPQCGENKQDLQTHDIELSGTDSKSHTTTQWKQTGFTNTLYQWAEWHRDYKGHTTMLWNKQGLQTHYIIELSGMVTLKVTPQCSENKWDLQTHWAEWHCGSKSHTTMKWKQTGFTNTLYHWAEWHRHSKSHTTLWIWTADLAVHTWGPKLNCRSLWFVPVLQHHCFLLLLLLLRKTAGGIQWCRHVLCHGIMEKTVLK